MNMARQKRFLEEICSRRQKIILSPHYDDSLLMIGGLIIKWKIEKRNVSEIIIFSKTDFAVKNVKIGKSISAARLAEERIIADKLGLEVRLLGEKDAPLRGYKLRRLHNFIFPARLNRKRDKRIYSRLISFCEKLLRKPAQIFLPLGLLEHPDHILIRDAMVDAVKRMKEKRKRVMAQVYFCEDHPYAGLASRKEWHAVEKFIKKQNLQPISCHINIKQKLSLLDIYKTQDTEIFKKSIINRALKLGDNLEMVYAIQEL